MGGEVVRKADLDDVESKKSLELNSADIDERELLKRLVIAHADLQNALSAITFLMEEVDENSQYTKIELRRLKCFETMFIVSYGRAFTKSKGRYDQISLRKIGVKLTPMERDLHNLIIKLRNSVYAHSDEEFAHVRLDLHTMEMPSGPYALPLLQFDDGLEFAGFAKQDAAVHLISKIMYGLFQTVQALAARHPEASLYLRPTQKQPEPDWGDISVGNASLIVLRPVTSKD